jgi:hypothetical protein
MKLVVQNLPQPKLIGEGIYAARLEKIEPVTTVNGDAYKFTFVITEDGEFNDRKINGICGVVLCSESKLYNWVSAIRCKEPNSGEEVDLDLLIGMNCEVTVEHREHGGRIFANVASVESLAEEYTSGTF